MVNVGQRRRGAKKAADVRARLAAGEDFAKLAGEVSESRRRPTAG